MNCTTVLWDSTGKSRDPNGAVGHPTPRCPIWQGRLLNAVCSTCVNELFEPGTTFFRFECASTSSEERHLTGCHNSYAVQICTFAYRQYNISPGTDLGTAFSSVTIEIKVRIIHPDKCPPISCACKHIFF